MNHEHRRRSLARSSVRVALLIVGLLPMLVACYPYDRESTSDYDVVATTFDPNADFSTKLTYSRPDEVFGVTDPTQPPADSVPANIQTAIFTAIDQNMTALGYTLEPDPALADVHIAPFVAENTWVGGSCYPYYWDYWYPYPPGYGWCYPVYYSYTTGTIVIAMLDPTLPTNSEPIWVAGINGIVDSVSSNISRINSAIDDAFNQSPYLRP